MSIAGEVTSVESQATQLLLDTLAAAEEPLTAKELHARLKEQLTISAADLATVADEQVAAGRLFRYPPASGRGADRYWSRDPLSQARDKVLEILAERPMNEKDLYTTLAGIAGPLTPPKDALTRFLDEQTARGELFRWQPNPKRPPVYSTQDVEQQVRARVLKVLSDQALTADELVERVPLPAGFTNKHLGTLLEQLVANRELYLHPATEPGGKKRYGTGEPADPVEETTARLLRTLGAQPRTLTELQAALEPLPAGFKPRQLKKLVQRLLREQVVFHHPPGEPGGEKRLGTAPPVDPVATVREQLLALIGEEPLAAAELAERLAPLPAGFEVRQLGRILRDLVQQQQVFPHPPAARGGEKRFASEPAKPAADITALFREALAAARKEGATAYPPALDRLLTQIDTPAGSRPANRALGQTNEAGERLFVVAAKAPNAPVFFREDLEEVARSPRLLEYALRAARSSKQVAFTVEQLGKQLAAELRAPFTAAVQRALASGSVPASVAWIAEKEPRLLLVTDLKPARRYGPDTEEPEERSGAAERSVALAEPETQAESEMVDAPVSAAPLL